jgi:hypothetical protein
MASSLEWDAEPPKGQPRDPLGSAITSHWGQCRRALTTKAERARTCAFDGGSPVSFRKRKCLRFNQSRELLPRVTNPKRVTFPPLDDMRTAVTVGMSCTVRDSMYITNIL